MAGLRFTTMVALMVLLAACSGNPTESAQAVNSPTQIVVTANPANEGFVARVNGVGISTVEYNRALERRSMGNAPDLALARQVLDELVEQALIRQGAPSIGIIVTDVDVEAEVAAQKEMTGGEAAWQASLAQNGYSEEEWFAAQADSLITLRVRNHLLEPYFGAVDQVHARHIVVRTLAEAESALDRLNAGEGFEALAAELSIDVTSRDNGGDLGWFAHNELFYSNLETIAFSLEAGQIAGPIATSLGYHIIQTIEKSLRPVEPERLQILSENIFNTWLDEQYRNASIEYYIQW